MMFSHFHSHQPRAGLKRFKKRLLNGGLFYCPFVGKTDIQTIILVLLLRPRGRAQREEKQETTF